MVRLTKNDEIGVARMGSLSARCEARRRGLISQSVLPFCFSHVSAVVVFLLSIVR